MEDEVRAKFRASLLANGPVTDAELEDFIGLVQRKLATRGLVRLDDVAGVCVGIIECALDPSGEVTQLATLMTPDPLSDDPSIDARQGLYLLARDEFPVEAALWVSYRLREARQGQEDRLSLKKRLLELLGLGRGGDSIARTGTSRQSLR